MSIAHVGSNGYMWFVVAVVAAAAAGGLVAVWNICSIEVLSHRLQELQVGQFEALQQDSCE